MKSSQCYVPLYHYKTASREVSLSLSLEKAAAVRRHRHTRWEFYLCLSNCTEDKNLTWSMWKEEVQSPRASRDGFRNKLRSSHFPSHSPNARSWSVLRKKVDTETPTNVDEEGQDSTNLTDCWVGEQERWAGTLEGMKKRATANEGPYVPYNIPSHL